MLADHCGGKTLHLSLEIGAIASEQLSGLAKHLFQIRIEVLL